MTFSYAQAARGILTPSNVSSNPGSSASSEKGFKETVKDITSTETTNTTNTNSASNSFAKTEEDNLAHNSSTSNNEDVSSMREQNLKDVKSSNGAVAANEVDTSIAQSENSIPKEETVHDSNHVTEKSKDAKEADDDWEKVSIPSTAAEKEKDKELRPAPIPAVNIWAQRTQQLQAKVKEPAATTSKAVPTSTSQKPRQANSNEEKRKSMIFDNTKIDQANRPSSGGRGAKEQNSGVSPRSMSTPNENAAVQPLPIDAQSWPTPENSTVEIGRRSSVRESTDRSETDNKAGGKQKWTPVPFVPTVKFETAMPSQARRGGKAATRGRGGITGQNDRYADKNEPGSMGPPPLPKTVSEQDRGRKASIVKTSRASSVPTAEDVASSTSQILDKSNNITGTQTPSTQEESRSSSRQPFQQKPEFNNDPFQNQNNMSPSRPYQSKHDGPRSSQDFGDRSQSKNTKRDSWRPNERPDRGRGGARGGRGGSHSNYNGSPYTSPLPQNGFESKGSENRHRQQSTQGFGTPYNTARGGNSRSQSIPIHMMQNFFQPGFPEGLPPIQTTLPYPVYGQPPSAMSGGSMSAMPFSNGLNEYTLVNIVKNQL